MDAYNVALPRDGGTCDFIAVYTAFHGEYAWRLSGGDLVPNNRITRQFCRVKEHEASGWIGERVETAVNVIRVRAWYTDEVCQAYSIDYCERRLEPDDIAEIERLIRAYWDIPF